MRSAVFVLSAMLWFLRLDLPGLVEVPASAAHGKTMAILYSGDGGWRTTDRGLARILANNGIPVAGLNTLRYFWKRRTPEGAAEDLARILTHYRSAWKKDKVIVIGYSFGADVLPFMLNRMPKPLLAHIEMLVLLAPTRTADFEFHLKQWFSDYTPKNSKPVLPELEKLNSIKILSFCGTLDGESLCRDLPANARRVFLDGAGHRFDKLYPAIAQDILKEIEAGKRQ